MKLYLTIEVAYDDASIKNANMFMHSLQAKLHEFVDNNLTPSGELVTELEYGVSSTMERNLLDKIILRLKGAKSCSYRACSCCDTARHAKNVLEMCEEEAVHAQGSKETV